MDYEGELAVVIGKHCKNVKPEKAEEYILGYTIMNDFTRGIFRKKRTNLPVQNALTHSHPWVPSSRLTSTGGGSP
ncbi:MAG: fumarylacetoacetate hydrolase family protein [Geovibrio sp.]|nr:fumarylacetoacetate hydrolase family protein [Geovibrio sp.]